VQEIPAKLLPIFWTALGLSGLSVLGVIVGLSMLLNSQRTRVLRIIWISAALFVASASAWIAILIHR
jgi:hypothetical protein